MPLHRPHTGSERFEVRKKVVYKQGKKGFADGEPAQSIFRARKAFSRRPRKEVRLLPWEHSGVWRTWTENVEPSLYISRVNILGLGQGSTKLYWVTAQRWNRGHVTFCHCVAPCKMCRKKEQNIGLKSPSMNASLGLGGLRRNFGTEGRSSGNYSFHYSLSPSPHLFEASFSPFPLFPALVPYSWIPFVTLVLFW